MTGWLTKEGAIWKTWRRRLFILQPPFLRYFKREGDEQPLGTIDLQTAGHIRGIQYKKMKFAFQVQTPRRTYILCGDTAEDRDKWVDILNSTLSSLRPVALKRAVQFSDFEILRVLEKMDENEKIVQARIRDEKTTYRMRIVKRSEPFASVWVDKYAAELVVLQKLEHPFVANLRHFIQTPDLFCFVTDDVPGICLSVILRKGGGLPYELVRFFAAEICLALEHLHSTGLLFPVLSPENVIVTPEGNCCLVSNSKLVASCRRDYKAPELFMCVPYTKAYDWWCYGCLIYELLIAKSPFRGDTEEEAKYSVNNDPVILPETIPQEAKNFVAKLLERRPDKRLTESNAIKRQEFLQPIDLELLYKKQIKPPVDLSSLTTVMGNTSQLPPTEDWNDFVGFSFVADFH